MTNAFKKLFSTVIFMLFIIAIVFSSFQQIFSLDNKVSDAYYKTAGILNQADDWEVIGLSRGGFDINEEYYNGIVNKVIEKNGVLSKNKYTEYSRTIITLTALGKDVSNVGGYNLLEYLEDYNKVKLQGINGVIWALIAIDCGEYPSSVRQILIDHILNAEIKTGGWALGGDKADADITAMAITSLAKYYYDDTIKSAVDRAVTALSKMQNDKGCFEFNNTESSESIAQVITALCTLGINPDKDKRFVKKGKSLIDSLLDFSLSSGGFSHIKGGAQNSIATEQAFYSLVAYNRLTENKSPLFQMKEKTAPEETTTTMVITHTSATANTTEKSVTKEYTTVPFFTEKGVIVTTIGESDTKPAENSNNTNQSYVEEVTIINNTAEETTQNKSSTKAVVATSNTETVTEATDLTTLKDNSITEEADSDDNKTLIIVAGSATVAMILVLIALIIKIIKRKKG